MGNPGEKLWPVADSVLAPGEELPGCCVATQSSVFTGRMVALVVTPERLVVQRPTAESDCAR